MRRAEEIIGNPRQNKLMENQLYDIRLKSDMVLLFTRITKASEHFWGVSKQKFTSEKDSAAHKQIYHGLPNHFPYDSGCKATV